MSAFSHYTILMFNSSTVLKHFVVVLVYIFGIIYVMTGKSKRDQNPYEIVRKQKPRGLFRKFVPVGSITVAKSLVAGVDVCLQNKLPIIKFWTK